jgi:hypothetical protein
MLRRLLKLVIIVSISVVVALLPEAFWLMVLNTPQADTFFSSLLVYPGYKLSLILSPELAHDESARLTLLPASLAINFGFYFLISCCSCLLIARLWGKRRT